MKRSMNWLGTGVFAAAVLSTATFADEGHANESVTWSGDPCTEPVLMIETDFDNVRNHIPASYPGTDEEFLGQVVSHVGADGTLKATVVITLNRCAVNTVETTVNGQVRRTESGSAWSEVLVMVLFDGPSPNGFEFYALADYVDAPGLATAFRSLGLPTQHTPNLVFSLPVDPLSPAPGAVVPLTVAVPNTFMVTGFVVRPNAFDTGGHATHHFHGARGLVSAEHDTPIGGMSFTSGTLTITGPQGAWLADLLGTSGPLAVGGFYLEKTGGHNHVAVLEE